MRSDLARFARGFVYAWNGIRAAVKEERNFSFHVCAAFYAFVAAYWAGLSAVETALIALCVAAVMALELMNSAVERAVDKPDTTHWWTAGAAKDMAAGAVLVMAIGTVIVAVCLFGPRLGVLWAAFTARWTRPVGILLSLLIFSKFIFQSSNLPIQHRKANNRMAKPIPEMPSSVFVALVGRPNVGKSSLTNYLVGEKVAIVTQKPQTTRSRITGVITKGPVQYVLMDTPGIHAAHNKLDARMTQTAAASLKDVDVTMMLFEPAGELTDSELTMIKALQKGGPAIAVINKVDLLDNFAALEARKKQIEEFGCFDHIVTISAKDGTGCDDLFALLKPYGNEGPHYFDDDAFTDMPEKELVAELVREKALLFMREEIPHGIAVVVERFKERPDKDLIDIDVDIYCERKSHKGMIIGKGGQMLKKIASAARMDIEELLGVKVNLQCWVKVREDWRDNEQLLNSLGFAKP